MTFLAATNQVNVWPLLITLTAVAVYLIARGGGPRPRF